MEAPVKKHPDGQPMLGPDGKPIVDEDAAAAAVWNVYYANHQAAGNFKTLSVLDPFMGGGTTLVEGSRLGFKHPRPPSPEPDPRRRQTEHHRN